MISSAASAACIIAPSISFASSSFGTPRTWSIRPCAGFPIPTLIRGKSSNPIRLSMLRIPLCVPAEPFMRILSAPQGRSMSSYITTSSSCCGLYHFKRSPTAHPELFINVSGFASTTRVPPSRPSPYTERNPFLFTEIFSLSAILSIVINPTL